jgi:hypothetical protein
MLHGVINSDAPDVGLLQHCVDLGFHHIVAFSNLMVNAHYLDMHNAHTHAKM